MVKRHGVPMGGGGGVGDKPYLSPGPSGKTGDGNLPGGRNNAFPESGDSLRIR